MNIELRLLATMLYQGDFGPLVRGEITADHFVTEEGKILHSFVTGYGVSTNGAAKFPSLSIVKKRFQATMIEIPEPDPGDTIDALAHETILERLRTRIRAAAEELEVIASTSPDPLNDLVPLISGLRTATEVSRPGQHTSLANGIREVVSAYKTGTILPRGLPWPWASMNGATKGLQRKEFIVIAGRPKSRKTFTALKMLTHTVFEEGCSGLIFTPEMPVRQMLLRCVAMKGALHYSEFKDGTLEKAEEMRLFEMAQDFGRIDGEDDEGYALRLYTEHGYAPKLNIVQSTGRDLAWIESQISMYKPDVVLFDSFYRQHADGVRKGAEEWRAVTALSRGLKDLTMNLDIASIGTHQLNRGAQKEIGDISNLSLADAVGQDADMILRVITGKLDGKDRSALVVLGGREVPFDGVLFNNLPCHDFSEIGPITNLKVVERLMKAEDDAQEEGAEEEGAPPGKGGKRRPTPKNKLLERAKKVASAFIDDDDDDEDDDEEEVAPAPPPPAKKKKKSPAQE